MNLPDFLYLIWGAYAVLWILSVILMVLTARLLITLNRYFKAKNINYFKNQNTNLISNDNNRSPSHRLLTLEKQFRLQTITPEEYATARERILNDL